MGIRKIGKKTVERDIEEEFCDNCEATIPERQYPEIVVDLQRDEWGDSQTMTFCGFACLDEWASKEDASLILQRETASPLKSLDQSVALVEGPMIQPWTDSLIAFLNELAALDPVALRALIYHRVACNQGLADHPTVQVDGREMAVGMLGILNGFCGSVEGGNRHGWGPIAAVFGEDGSFRFERSEAVSCLEPLHERDGVVPL